MSKKKEVFISRQVVEVRFKNKIFSFIDRKGEFTDFIVPKLSYEEIAISGNRVDFTKESKSVKSFYSWENFGVQLEARDNFNELVSCIKENISVLDDYKKIEIKDIARIGTRITGLYHFPNMSVDQTKESFDKVFFSHQSLFEGDSGIKIVDNGLFALDIEKDNYKAHVSIGIMSKDEALLKVFDPDLYSVFNYSSGIYYDIDLYDENFEFDSLNKLQKALLGQIEKLEELQLALVKKLEL